MLLIQLSTREEKHITSLNSIYKNMKIKYNNYKKLINNRTNKYKGYRMK